MPSWLQTCAELLQAREPVALVTVAGVRGSAPRETGARMLVTRTQSIGTIGGGRLEHDCTRMACELLRAPAGQRSREHRFTLGPDCGQCCGGVVEVFFERLTDTDTNWITAAADAFQAGRTLTRISLRRHETNAGRFVAAGSDVLYTSGEFSADADYQAAARALHGDRDVTRLDALAVTATLRAPVLIDRTTPERWPVLVFGAGHVGTALAEMLALTPADLMLYDSRPEYVAAALARGLPGRPLTAPAEVIAAAPENTSFVVMTHDHALDLELVSLILNRGGFQYCGLIGSGAKRRRFLQRLRQAGLSDRALAALTCPIGGTDIDGRQPWQIAIAVSAELVSVQSQRDSATVSVDRSTSGARPRDV